MWYQARNWITQATIAAQNAKTHFWHFFRMRNHPSKTWQGNAFPPKTLTFQQAHYYTGLSVETLENYAKADLITVSNMIMPGATRGRKLIDRKSLDLLIDSSVGVPTTAVICQKKRGAS